jgi:hypothetical protein
MDERPRPDLEHTREALRQHDERAEESVSDEDTPDAGEEKPAPDDSGDE